jgi:hypothetical protein
LVVDDFECDIDFIEPATKRARIEKPPRDTTFEAVSIARLIVQKRESGDVDRFKKAVFSLKTADTQTLIVRIATTTDALTLWALHVTLDKRDIPPALRWPTNDSTPQMVFITWLADVAWFAKRHPEHKAKFRGWQRLLRERPSSPKWLECAFWLFHNVYDKRSLAYVGAKGLALTQVQRQPLMLFTTSAMVAARRELQSTAFEATREALYSHAKARRGMSGSSTPESTANRRACLWRVHVLLGHSPTETARGWQSLTGETSSRQAISKTLEIIKAVRHEARILASSGFESVPKFE